MMKNFASAILVSMALSGCGDEVTPSLERKSGTVTPTGYVDLIPPTNYSPIRGVICESLNSTDGHLAGACFDLEGPSEKWTRKYISDQAADDLMENYGGLFDPERGYFEMKTKIACSLVIRECRSIDGTSFERGVTLIAHTEALFGFSPEY